MDLNDALALLNVDTSRSPEEQLDAARRRFLVLAGKEHPDKGGDAERFLEVKNAYDLVLAKLNIEEDTQNIIDTLATFLPAKEPVPPYAVQGSIGTRKCQGCKQPILPNTPCLGALWSMTNTYGGWRHLHKKCMRVPTPLTARLTAMDVMHGNCVNDERETFKDVLRNSEDVVKGIDTLTPKHFAQLLEVVLDRNTWSVRKSADEAPAEVAKAHDAPFANDAAIVPLPPMDPVEFKPNALRGYVFVTTGKFTLPGTSEGLNQGKNEIKTIIVNAGGANPGNVTGKTTHLVVGDLPGNKVDHADARGIKKIDLVGLTQLLSGVPDKDVKAICTIGMERSAGFPTNKNKQLAAEGPLAKVPRLEA